MGLSVSIESTKDFEVVTEMIQPGVLADIVDKGEVPNKFKPGTTQPKCMFVWILAEEDSEGRNKRVFETFTLSLNEKATLRKRLNSLGYKEQIESGAAFDLDSIVGIKRMLVMSEEDGSEPGKKFIKVTAVMALKKGQNAPDIPAGFVRKQDQPAK
jgi:hypothetical protein